MLVSKEYVNEIIASPLFSKVVATINDAHLIAWDGCHKIYLAMDEEEADWFRENYPSVMDDTPKAMLNMLVAWWDSSCGLRFIQAVTRNPENPNAGYVTLIGQFDDDDEDEDEDEE
jgi:hypothetical protein